MSDALWDSNSKISFIFDACTMKISLYDDVIFSEGKHYSYRNLLLYSQDIRCLLRYLGVINSLCTSCCTIEEMSAYLSKMSNGQVKVSNIKNLLFLAIAANLICLRPDKKLVAA